MNKSKYLQKNLPNLTENKKQLDYSLSALFENIWRLTAVCDHLRDLTNHIQDKVMVYGKILHDINRDNFVYFDPDNDTREEDWVEGVHILEDLKEKLESIPLSACGQEDIEGPLVTLEKTAQALKGAILKLSSEVKVTQKTWLLLLTKPGNIKGD